MNIITVLPHESMMNFVIKDVKDVYREDLRNKICYISLNKSHASLIESLIAEDVDTDRLFIIDAVTKSAVKKPKAQSNCVFVNSPVDFNELFTKVDTLLKKQEIGAVVFDSICTLSAYRDKKEVVDFLRKFAARVAVAQCEGVFVAIKHNIEPEMLDKLTMVADRVLYMEST